MVDVVANHMGMPIVHSHARSGGSNTYLPNFYMDRLTYCDYYE